MRPILRNTIPVCLTLSATLVMAPAPLHAKPCIDSPLNLGVSRIVEIDVSGGPMFGSITRRKSEVRFLKKKEVVLTFDDGPSPAITNSILKTLDKFCVKASFFAVGEMAISYPKTLRRILAKGHTLGAHTWSHPLHLNRMRLGRAVDEIEKGFSAVAMAAGQPIAPFFRFPGLNDSRQLLNYLQKRSIGSFTVDVVSDDSFIHDPVKLARITIERIEHNHGGIVLFHDIKRATASALPSILSALKKRGYRIVHIKAKKNLVPVKKHDVRLAKILARVTRRAKSGDHGKSGKAQKDGALSRPRLLAFYGSLGPGKYAKMRYLGPPVTTLAPAPRNRLRKAADKSKVGLKAGPIGRACAGKVGGAKRSIRVKIGPTWAPQWKNSDLRR